MIWLILIIGVLSAMFIYYQLSKSLAFWKERDVPHKNFSGFMGNPLKMFYNQISIVEHINNLYKEFSNERYYGGLNILRPILYINDFDLIKRITVQDYEYFLDRNNIVTEDVEPLLGKNLVNLKGQKWRDMRATLSPSFTSSKMKMMFTLLSECAEEVTSYFEKQQRSLIDVEMKDIFARFTNDAIATVAFGYKCNSLEDKENEFYVMGKKATNFSGLRFVAFMMHIIVPDLAKFLKIPLLPGSVTTFFRRVIKDNIKKREQEGLIRPDMIHLLMETRKGEIETEDATANDPDTSFAAVKESMVLHTAKKHKIELTDDDLTAQAFIFFFGGFDTSSTLMSFVAYELAMSEGVQRKLQQEIRETLTECNGKITYEALHKMKYMDMVVSETLRKWPSGFIIDRICVKNYVIEPVHAHEKPLVVEKGLIVHVPVYGIHHNPKYFPNPEEFDPERFSDQNKHNIHPFSYFPFGSGPRSCIASRFALMENKIIIFHILSKFDFVRIPKTPFPMKLAPNTINLGPSAGFWLGLRRRELA